MVAFKNSTGIKANSSFCTFRFPIAEAHQLTKPFQYQPISTTSPTQPFAHFVFMPIVGRERECQEPRRAMESDRSEFVIVYRRRRVGKTFLVDQYYHGQYDFTFVGGHNLSRQRQLRVLRVH